MEKEFNSETNSMLVHYAIKFVKVKRGLN